MLLWFYLRVFQGLSGIIIPSTLSWWKEIFAFSVLERHLDFARQSRVRVSLTQNFAAIGQLLSLRFAWGNSETRLYYFLLKTFFLSTKYLKTFLWASEFNNLMMISKILPQLLIVSEHSLLFFPISMKISSVILNTFCLIYLLLLFLEK